MRQALLVANLANFIFCTNVLHTELRKSVFVNMLMITHILMVALRLTLAFLFTLVYTMLFAH